MTTIDMNPSEESLKQRKFLSLDQRIVLDEFGQIFVKKEEYGGTSCIYVRDVRNKMCGICGRGWELTGTSFLDQRHSQIFDNEPIHLSCDLKFRAYHERSTVFHALCNARIIFNKIEAIPNQYWGSSDPYGALKPWYQISKEKSWNFVIGFRKNVWSIKLTDVHISKDDLQILKDSFHLENVTKEFDENSILIHAWSDEKMQEYIKIIAKVLHLRKE